MDHATINLDLQICFAGLFPPSHARRECFILKADLKTRYILATEKLVPFSTNTSECVSLENDKKTTSPSQNPHL